MIRGKYPLNPRVGREVGLLEGRDGGEQAVDELAVHPLPLKYQPVVRIVLKCQQVHAAVRRG